VVPVTATTILLREAECALRLAAQGGGLSHLEIAFLAWLRAEPPPSSLVDVLAHPLRQYEHVALAALADVAGWAVVDRSNFDDGLRWLVEVALERARVPAPVVTDGLAHVVLGLAARERLWLAAWHDQVLARGAGSIAPAWLGEGGRIARGSATSDAVELRIALASRGVVTSSDADATALLERLKDGELPDDAFHARVLLAALEWTRRTAPIVLPGQATPETVALLLAEAPRALQQWPWEDKPKTKNSRAAKWYVDNEYHVQALLWAMLAPVFPDLRREEYAPQVGPIQPRVDFGIPSLRLLIEAKFARTRSALKETVNEIAQDNSNYFTTPSPYDRLLVFVWDNGAHSEDHALIREGMRKYDRVVDAIIVSRPGHLTDDVQAAEASGGDMAQ
jgi:REase_DpnII-MboI